MRCQDDPGYNYGQQPAPAPLDEVLIQGIIGSGEIGMRHRDEVCDQRNDEYRATVDGHLEPGVEQQGLLADVQQHGDQDKANRARCCSRPSATAVLLLRVARPEVHSAARTWTTAGITRRAGVSGRRVDAASLTCRHRVSILVIGSRRHLEPSH